MRKLIFLSALIMIGAAGSVFAQRGNTSRPVTNPPANRNTDNARTRSERRNTDERRTDRQRTDEKRTDNQRTENRSETVRQPPARVGRLLRGLDLSDEQKAQTRQILKEAKENNTPGNEVLRSINSILTPEQSEIFKKKIKRIRNRQNQNGDSPAATDGNDSNP